MTAFARLWSGRFAPLAIWAVLAVALVIAFWPMIASLTASDPDDYMRLAEARDWLAGQGWYDLRQHRFDPPAGADMHWSRLVDLPIAAVLFALSPLLAEPVLSATAMTIVPLAQLLLLLVLVDALARELGGSRPMRLAAMALAPLFPLLASNFAPMRVDHHGWQALTALGSALLLVRPATRRGEWLAGALAALWLAISVEGLPLVGVLAAIRGIVWWRDGAPRALGPGPFLAGLTGAGLLLVLVGHPPGALGTPWCDSLSWPHVAAFLAAALPLYLGASLPHRTARAAVLALSGGMALAIARIGLGACSFNPWAGMDPVLRDWWLDRIPEGLNVLAQEPAHAAMLVWTVLLIAAGWWQARTANPARWDRLGLYALGTGLFSLTMMRAGLAAQVLCLPFAAALAGQWLPRARAVPAALPRIAATLACLALLTPAVPTAVGRWLGVLAPSAQAAPVDAVARSAPIERPADALVARTPSCNLAGLDRVPPARIMATMGLGPELLVRTRHSAVMSGYHRNQAAMRAVVETFSGDPAQAEAIVRRYGAGYVLFCPGGAEAAILAQRRPDSLANQLLQARPPAWLDPEPLRSGGAELYRVRTARKEPA